MQTMVALSGTQCSLDSGSEDILYWLWLAGGSDAAIRAEDADIVFLPRPVAAEALVCSLPCDELSKP